MGAQEGDLVDVAGGDLGRQFLGGDVQPVSGLSLQGGGASGVGGPDAFDQQFLEALLTGFAGGGHGHGDAARGIVRARHAGLELSGAVAVEDHVGVGVHPTGQHGASAQLHLLVGRRSGGRLPHPGDLPVLGDQRGVVQGAQVGDGVLL